MPPNGALFSIPGVGVYIVNGVNNRDYIVVQGGVILLATAFSIIMLLVDLVIAWIDPRVKAQITGGKKRRHPGKEAQTA